MKAIFNLIALALFCLILTPSFAGTHPKADEPATGTFKKLFMKRVKIKLPNNTTYYYADIYFHEFGPSVQNGVTVNDIETYAELVDQSGNTIVPGVAVNVNLVILLGPPGDNTQTPIQYQIPYNSYHSPMLNGWTQRPISVSDVVSVNCSPSALGSIPLVPSGPYSF